MKSVQTVLQNEVMFKLSFTINSPDPNNEKVYIVLSEKSEIPSIELPKQINVANWDNIINVYISDEAFLYLFSPF